jgi:hypothetical protein
MVKNSPSRGSTVPLSIGDVVKHRLDDLEVEANVLRDRYIAKP